MKTKSLKLSSNLLQMKFMKKVAVEAQEEAAEDEKKQLIDDEHWYLDVKQEAKKSDKSVFVMEPSYVVFDELVFGRMSFNGFNPQVEKLMKSNGDESKVHESDEEKDVTDATMADHYGTLNETISKKFKRVKPNTKANNHNKIKRLGTK